MTSATLQIPARAPGGAVPAGAERVPGDPPAAAGEAAQAERLEPRRVLNVTLAALGVVLLAPLMVLIAILVKLTSPGPVLYTQPRVGINRRGGSDDDGRRLVDYGGRLFRIYKFRTMTAPQERQAWACQDDPRVTPLGRVLRNMRLDELPQLFNVLKGDMNLVGPRPEQPGIFMALREQIPGYEERQRVLPGLTGWAQINLHYDRDLNDVRRKLALDLEYIGRASALHDLRIVLATLPSLLWRQLGW
jgi:lipopolysaccharide/colanic/teichoic acid biosynthesis glycosyltransferase